MNIYRTSFALFAAGAAIVLAGCSTAYETELAEVSEPNASPTEALTHESLDAETTRWVDLTNEVFGDCFTTFGKVDSYYFVDSPDGWSVGVLYIYFESETLQFLVGQDTNGQDITVAWSNTDTDEILDSVGCYD